jgi:adenosylcobinamide-phosphate synthase
LDPVVFFVPHDWRVALATVLLAGLFDVAIGEPPNALHPVVWMGRLVGALMARRPHSRPRAELAYGALIVALTTGSAAAAGLLLTLGLSHLPWWAALPIGAWVLKTAFSLRGLVRAGCDVQRALASGTEAARTRLAALVSRSPDLDPPLIVSATVESLAENITDSVVSPLLYFALFGLPGDRKSVV